MQFFPVQMLRTSICHMFQFNATTVMSHATALYISEFTVHQLILRRTLKHNTSVFVYTLHYKQGVLHRLLL